MLAEEIHASMKRIKALICYSLRRDWRSSLKGQWSGIKLRAGAGCSESLQNQGSENQDWVEIASSQRWGGPGDKCSWEYTAKAHSKL